MAFALTVHEVQGLTLERAVLLLGRNIGRCIGRVSWSLLYMALSRVKKLEHVRFFPHGRRGSVECFKYLTKLKPPAKLVKWTEAYKSSWWNGDILKSNQLRKAAAIEAKLAQLGRGETLSLKNDILKGYLGGLGYPRLWELKRIPLQHQLNDHMVRKRGWKHTDDVSEIERRTKRSCQRPPRNSSSRIRKNQQGTIKNQNSAGFPKVKNIPQKPAVQASGKSITRTALLVSRPARRSKRLREKASGYIVDGVGWQNEASLCVPKKKKKKIYGDKQSDGNALIYAQQQEQAIFQLLHAEEDEIKSHYYKEVCVDIQGFGNKVTVYNHGGGDCFFIAVQQGLRQLKMVEFDNDEMRQNLSLWFQDDNNAAAITSLHTASPCDIIPYLDNVGGPKPRQGWTKYLSGRDWKFWGRRIARKGVWVGAIELEAMNDLLLNTGYDVRVNIYDSRSKKLFGEDRNIPGQLVIILYLSDGHFELLYPITRSP